jgi:hypothetical protein
MVGIACASGHPAFAGAFIWDNTTNSTAWSTATNWLPNGVPQNAGDTATINGFGNKSIILNDLLRARRRGEPELRRD